MIENGTPPNIEQRGLAAIIAPDLAQRRPLKFRQIQETAQESASLAAASAYYLPPIRARER